MEAVGVPFNFWGSSGIFGREGGSGCGLLDAALPGQEGSSVRLRKGSNNQHVVGGGRVARRRVGGGALGWRSVAVVDRRGQ